ncbi:hypothetical protein Q4566_00120 [Tamlana sp. 2_MG-2023]|uniref:hypothetical protein n=1 Tax=unclassified Tamlana TaxID=2614803 RepID=UPI0026E46475|nr:MULTISPECIES: hypothetical protein [unclassified Tamlana]MDO6758586.1 hypothetical protein [Tamlana sp. 2_MG-2023]MDO6789285.1 hypothetical protein [Tamlana sp. 1_MG-2023]
MKQQLPLNHIEHLIPQKAPFIMVDTLLEFSAENVVSSFLISKDNLFVNNSQLLEPGLIENMAQSVALHTGYDYFLKGEEAPTGYIGAIKKVEVFGLPMLNDRIITKVKILHEFMGVTMVEVAVFNKVNERLAQAEMKTVIASDA